MLAHGPDGSRPGCKGAPGCPRYWRSAWAWREVFLGDAGVRGRGAGALAGFSGIGRDELARFLTLTPADVAFVDPGRGRGPADRPGLAVASCTLPWLGFLPDKVLSAPPVAGARPAEQLGVDPAGLRSYGRRAKTRTEHYGGRERLGSRLLGDVEVTEPPGQRGDHPPNESNSTPSP
ncbi:DUF4158 domain-containing protein [Nonomuraea dietziae]|uniref:DUF4158 domain-containing protein n=1 Tax=Nonomuraea dietziae TaxID=65515 RepID=UPI00341F8029